MEQRDIQSGLSAENFVKDPKRKALIEKWNKLMPTHNKHGQSFKMDPHSRYCLAQLFENQAAELNAFKEKHQLSEDTSTTNTAPFIKHTFPLLRRVWPALIAPEIVSVQPMSAPVGAIFYFELKYGSAKGKVASGDKLVEKFNATYSSQYIDGELIGTGNGSLTSFSATLAWLTIKPLSLKVTAGSIVGVADAAGVITGTGIAGGSTVNYTTGAITVVFSAAPASNVQVLVTYEYNSEANSKVPDINLDIALVAVTAKSRKLKALWSSEAADDLKALHGVDAEQELVAGLGSELALEIDREIIEDLRLGATGGTATFDLAAIPSGVSEIDHIRSLVTKMTIVANQVGKNTLRGTANFAVMNYDIAGHLEQLQTSALFRPIFAGNAEALAAAELPQNFGLMKMGTLAGRYVCYKDNYMATNEIVLGYKGQNFVDAGYVWAPYVPMQVTNTFLDPNDFKFRKGLRTRYAKLLARGEFFGKVTVSNVGGVTPGAFGPQSTTY